MTRQPENNLDKIKLSIGQGLEKGWSSFVWLLKIILPISFITMILVYLGVLDKLDFILNPVMVWLGLPPSAALVIILGFFTGIYGTVAALSAMPFSVEHMTLIAIFSLICHNIIQESIVQGRSGINPFFAAFFRLLIAFLVTFICAKIMGVNSQTNMMGVTTTSVKQIQSFMEIIQGWGWTTLKLVLQIFCIIMPLMVLLQLGKTFHIIDGITDMISPILRVLGLSRSTGMLWLTACVFGLAYGSAVIVEQTQSYEFKKQDLRRLHLSIGVNHSMIEDPALFLPLGLPAFWLWVPRLIAAVLVVWLYWAVSSVRRLYA